MMLALGFLLGAVFGAAAVIVAGCLVAARGEDQRKPVPAGAAPTDSPAPSYRKTVQAIGLLDGGIRIEAASDEIIADWLARCS